MLLERAQALEAEIEQKDVELYEKDNLINEKETEIEHFRRKMLSQEAQLEDVENSYWVGFWNSKSKFTEQNQYYTSHMHKISPTSC